MNKLSTVFKFEFLEMLRKRSVKVTTLILFMAVLFITSIPTIQTFFKEDPSSEPQTGEVVTEIRNEWGFIFEDESIDKAMFASMLGLDHLKQFDSETTMKTSLLNKEIKKGFILHSSTAYKALTIDKDMFGFEDGIIEDTLKTMAIDENFKANNIDVNEARNAMNVSITSEVETIGKDSSQGFFIAYVIMFAMYMLILFFGQSVATSVAREKDSRTMELLITSTDPKVLILGKVFAMGAVGLLQVGTILLSVFIGFMVNKVNYDPDILMMVQGSLTFYTAIVYLVFSIAGYILYLYIFAALGSLISKVEDVSSATTPITVLFVIAFFIASSSLSAPDSQLTIISSYVPFVSLFTMPIRFMLTSVNWIEIVVSMAIMILSTLVIAKISVYIYRFGSLNYGNKLKIKDILKAKK
ncbi:ABC transporter permease [Erysipelothrix piscisicarius]|uniref:ABC transporter permease n=1 Tax=Erysipelothrix piscisicarius TaxID=2485784 RepID=A0A3S8RNT8_9FIRM|nr:ABC transporter permease [Erysipelothrix piscisicarius]AZK44685.1 ABC transporter permease [Erysipelothrix piscisicarius]